MPGQNGFEAGYSLIKTILEGLADGAYKVLDSAEGLAIYSVDYYEKKQRQKRETGDLNKLENTVTFKLAQRSDVDAIEKELSDMGYLKHSPDYNECVEKGTYKIYYHDNGICEFIFNSRNEAEISAIDKLKTPTDIDIPADKYSNDERDIFNNSERIETTVDEKTHTFISPIGMKISLEDGDMISKLENNSIKEIIPELSEEEIVEYNIQIRIIENNEGCPIVNQDINGELYHVAVLTSDNETVMDFLKNKMDNVLTEHETERKIQEFNNRERDGINNPNVSLKELNSLNNILHPDKNLMSIDIPLSCSDMAEYYCKNNNIYSTQEIVWAGNYENDGIAKVLFLSDDKDKMNNFNNMIQVLQSKEVKESFNALSKRHEEYLSNQIKELYKLPQNKGKEIKFGNKVLKNNGKEIIIKNKDREIRKNIKEFQDNPKGILNYIINEAPVLNKQFVESTAENKTNERTNKELFENFKKSMQKDETKKLFELYAKREALRQAKLAIDENPRDPSDLQQEENIYQSFETFYASVYLVNNNEKEEAKEYQSIFNDKYQEIINRYKNDMDTQGIESEIKEIEDQLNEKMDFLDSNIIDAKEISQGIVLEMINKEQSKYEIDNLDEIEIKDKDYEIEITKE